MPSSHRSLHTEILEFKARIPHAEAYVAMREKLVKAHACREGSTYQIDTYFEVPSGRLKLREVENHPGAQLIFYERENRKEPKISSVVILEIPQSARTRLKQVFSRILATKAVVEKQREIYRHETIEIHLDDVEDLGFFIEFELQLAEDSQQQKVDRHRFEMLREQLEIHSHSLEKLSYSDLI